jgi:hypothetical protein
MREDFMPQSNLTLSLMALSLLVFGVSVSAETLRCRSVNGNVTCAGSGAVSCQTVNGRKVCVSGGGDIVQSFGKSAADPDRADRHLDTGDESAEPGEVDEMTGPASPGARKTPPKQSPHGAGPSSDRNDALVKSGSDHLSVHEEW